MRVNDRVNGWKCIHLKIMNDIKQWAKRMIAPSDSYQVEWLVFDPANDCFALVVRNWIKPENALQLYNYFCENVPWEQDQVKMGGRVMDQARLTYNCGTDVGKMIRWTGTDFPLRAMIYPMQAICDRAEKETKLRFNTIANNYYRDGTDYISYHADKYSAKGPMRQVLSVTLGGSRDFYLKRLSDDHVVKTVLDNGSAFMMFGSNMQTLYKHSVPKRAHAKPRISLTLREY